MGRLVARILFAATSIALFGCSAAPGNEGDDEDEVSAYDSAVSGVVEEGTVLSVTATSLNLREGPSTGTTILDVLDKGDLVTCAETSGADGWVSVVTASGDEGWVSRKYVVAEGDTGGSGGSETCDPSRAIGAVGVYQKALHDSIAYAEGTQNVAKDGYNVMFSFKLFQSCDKHPSQCIKNGGSCSTAAGRYQFLKQTWSSVKSAKSLTAFEPEDQERGAAYLVNTVRKVTVPADRPMTASEFSNAMSKLSWEWASLPPGRYGQPNKSLSQMRSKYCSIAGC